MTVAKDSEKPESLDDQFSLERATDRGDIILEGMGQLVRLPESEGREIELLIDDVTPNPEQPREYCDPKEKQELQDSIENNGQKVPISVVPYEEMSSGKIKFLIVDGAGRRDATLNLGRSTIKAIIKWIPTRQGIFEEALVTMVRQKMNPIDQAKAIQRLMRIYQDGHVLSVEDATKMVSRVMGEPASSVNRLRSLLNLLDGIQDMVKRKVIGIDAAFKLARKKKKVGDAFDLPKVMENIEEVAQQNEIASGAPEAVTTPKVLGIAHAHVKDVDPVKAAEGEARDAIAGFQRSLMSVVDRGNALLGTEAEILGRILRKPEEIVKMTGGALAMLLRVAESFGADIDGVSIKAKKDELEELSAYELLRKWREEGNATNDLIGRIATMFARRADYKGPEPLRLNDLVESVSHLRSNEDDEEELPEDQKREAILSAIEEMMKTLPDYRLAVFVGDFRSENPSFTLAKLERGEMKSLLDE